jgi:S-layer protein (TIGR01567 family)
MGFLAKEYFAGYSEDLVDDATPYLYQQSNNRNLLTDEQLSEVLYDDDTEMTVTSGTPLKLKEGYELAIKAIDIDGNKVYVELTKDGAVVDSKVISPSRAGATMTDKTYYYKKDIGDTKDLVIIGVNFKNAFRGSDTNLATIDGVFQISDTPTSVEVDTEYGKMRIASVDATEKIITMDNKDNSLTLSKNRDVNLMENVNIKTADQDEVTADNPLRYYIYKEISEAGTHELRGSVQTVVDGATNTWTPDSFAGFFYDIDDGIGTEQLDLTITGNKIDEPTGARYTSKAEAKDFDYAAWGKYWTMGFLAKEYFAGYSEDLVDDATPYLYQQSNNRNLLTDEQLSEVLYDDDTEMTVTSGTPLELKEGYELAIKAIDIDGNKVYVELTKDGAVVDSKVISPSRAGATMTDKTYYYKKDIGDTKDLVIIGVNFKNAFRGSDTNLATIDGVFQISDTPTSVEVDTEYGKMRIASVDATEKIITMDNKDNSLTLSKNRDVNLMENVNIKTADQDEVTADNPLRYYIYKAVTIEGEAATPAADVAAARAAEAAATEDVAAAEAAEAAAAENVSAAETAAAEAAPAAEEEHAAEAPPAEPATNETPGFGSIFALTGLMAVAYLVLNRRE